MKRKIITLALVATMALSFAACGDSNTQSGGSAESSAPAEQQTEQEGPTVEEENGMRKETYYTNEDLNLTGETGPMKYTVTAVQVSNVSTEDDATASLLGLTADQVAGLVVVNFEIENTSTDTISWYPDQSTITTNTQEQADAQMFLSGDVGGDYIGNVKKSGEVMFVLPNSDAQDLTQVSIHVDGPYDANFNSVGDAVTIDISVNQ